MPMTTKLGRVMTWKRDGAYPYSHMTFYSSGLARSRDKLKAISPLPQ